MKLASFAIGALPHLAGAILLMLHHEAAPLEPTHVPKVEPSHAGITIREDKPRTPRPARTLTMRLEKGEQVPEGHPNTWVHIPNAYDTTSGPALTFVFHGFKNCIESYTSAGIQCTPTNIKRPGYQIAAQLEREGSRSIVVVPETSFDVFSAEAPLLAGHGAFRAYVDELLAAIADETGGAHIDDVRRLALVASSGGYQALEPILDDATSMVTDVLLVDAGYMYPKSSVGRFLSRCTSELAASPTPRHRAGIIYTPSGGALPMSTELLRATVRQLENLGAVDRGRFGHFRGDPSRDDLSAPLYVLRVDEEHDVVVRRNLGRVIAAAGL